MENVYSRYRYEIIASLLCLCLGSLSGFAVSAGDSVWFASLAKPSFNPPSWVFAPVWTLLYLMMGIALGRIIKHLPDSKWLLGLFLVQFSFNLAWSPLFFYFHRIDLALYDLAALWLSLLLLLIAAHKQRLILALLSPYFFWVSFAAFLNYSIFRLN
jgi:benzodiazapine receptor